MKNWLSLVNILVSFLFLSLPCTVDGQTSNLNRRMDDYYLLERLDVLNKRVSDTLYTNMNSVSRKDAVQFLEQYTEEHAGSLSNRDEEEIRQFIAKSGEMASNGDGAIDSKYPVLKKIYKKQTDFVSIIKEDYSLIINPILYYQKNMESGNNSENLFINTRGAEVRATIARRIGLYTTFTDNQERGPGYHVYQVRTRGAVPGNAYYKDFKTTGTAQDYIFAAGYVDVEAVKNKINLSFGHGRNQWGDGYRSLFLSDFSANYLFFKINTRLGRFNYQNLFTEITPQYFRKGDKLLPKKYATMHYLNFNATRWLTLGLFEAIVFGRQDHFDFQYMNPVIFYRSIEQANGSPDNANLGLSFKANTKWHTVLYGQLLFDEFNFAQMKSKEKWWGNKYAFQLGAKVADVFGIRNLMIRAEYNYIRPFTYSFRDSVANYTHYNQPLAHPRGSNLTEFSLHIHYKPTRKLYLTSRTFFLKQGLDSVLIKKSYGGDVFKNYDWRNRENGIKMYNGYPTTVFYSNVNASYELRPNAFIDAGLTFRREESTAVFNPSFNTLQTYLGLRLNTHRREYDY
jgi:arsenate reductase-like glutaredoxin family protein